MNCFKRNCKDEIGADGSISLCPDDHEPGPTQGQEQPWVSFGNGAHPAICLCGHPSGPCRYHRGAHRTPGGPAHKFVASARPATEECTCGGVDIGVGTMHEPGCPLGPAPAEKRPTCDSVGNCGGTVVHCELPLGHSGYHSGPPAGHSWATAEKLPATEQTPHYSVVEKPETFLLVQDDQPEQFSYARFWQRGHAQFVADLLNAHYAPAEKRAEDVMPDGTTRPATGVYQQYCLMHSKSFPADQLCPACNE